MNPQPDPMIGHIVAAVFLLTLFLYTIKAIQENKTFQLNDNFVIGYIESEPIIVKHEIHNNHKIIKTQNEKVKKVIDFENQQFYTDCIDALIALGMKKREAKHKTMLIFSTSNPQPKTIQEFLIIALKLP